jgi:hypothetical protein
MLDCHIKGGETNYLPVLIEDGMTAISHIHAKAKIAYAKCERFVVRSDEEVTSVVSILKNEEFIQYNWLENLSQNMRWEFITYQNKHV